MHPAAALLQMPPRTPLPVGNDPGRKVPGSKFRPWHPDSPQNGVNPRREVRREAPGPTIKLAQFVSVGGKMNVFSTQLDESGGLSTWPFDHWIKFAPRNQRLPPRRSGPLTGNRQNVHSLPLLNEIGRSINDSGSVSGRVLGRESHAGVRIRANSRITWSWTGSHARSIPTRRFQPHHPISDVIPFNPEDPRADRPSSSQPGPGRPAIHTPAPGKESRNQSGIVRTQSFAQADVVPAGTQRRAPPLSKFDRPRRTRHARRDAAKDEGRPRRPSPLRRPRSRPDAPRAPSQG